jgi:gliding motility-associated-like protein
MRERPVVDLSSDETLFCRSDTLSYPLNFFPPSGGLFYGQGLDQDGVFHPNQSNSGEVDLAYTVANNGCATTDSLIIYVYGEGDVSLSNLPNFCQSAEPIELDIAIPAGGVYTIDGIETQLLNPALLSPGTHELAYQVVFGQSCNISVANVFNVIQRPATPSIQVEPDSVVCAGDSITLQCTPFTKYVWSTGDTTRSTVTFESGQFSVQTKSSLGCLSLPASISVIVTDSLLGDLSSPLYPSGFPISVFGLTDGSIELSLSGGAAPFEILWSTGEDSVYVIDSLGIGTYYVSVSDRAGCFFSDTISLEQPDEVILPNVFSLPNGFTPNGDGFNDAYKINGLLPEYAINQFRVWDIKRRLVFEAKNYDNTWTGLDLDGNKLPAGTYFATFESEGLDKVERFFIDLRYE